ncbi:hypothetical protein EC957_009307 [Mortierella hygrophila]|uniref:NmrA-like domain-containing protein n=1 Tax=Mortierella hygrophila TaxID=979708 RepID=A0A9P6FBW3_9FUNG|nr:hypothetical protein EC957_009307 [Mortierella hygrophila]
MPHNILIIGATGNTGRSVLAHLPALLTSAGLDYQILALTRSLTSPASQSLSLLPRVTIVEKDWTAITAPWLLANSVQRIYIAPHNLPTQFFDESALLVAALAAGVKYIVKLSTNLCFIDPTSPVYYGRTHWAVEELLSTPEYGDVMWTALRPNVFTSSFLGNAVGWIREYRETGTQTCLNVIPAADVPIALIDPVDVGRAAAALLALPDPSPHNRKRYVLSGPADVTGRDIADIVGREAGVPVAETKFQYQDWLEGLASQGYGESAVGSIRTGIEMVWDGRSGLECAPTAGEMLGLCPPRVGVAESLRAALEERGE